MWCPGQQPVRMPLPEKVCVIVFDFNLSTDPRTFYFLNRFVPFDSSQLICNSLPDSSAPIGSTPVSSRGYSLRGLSFGLRYREPKNVSAVRKLDFDPPKTDMAFSPGLSSTPNLKKAPLKLSPGNELFDSKLWIQLLLVSAKVSCIFCWTLFVSDQASPASTISSIGDENPRWLLHHFDILSHLIWGLKKRIHIFRNSKRSLNFSINRGRALDDSFAPERVSLECPIDHGLWTRRWNIF